MKFMIVESFKGGSPRAVYERVRERGRLLPEGLEYVDSWVSADLQRCYQLMRCESIELIHDWTSHWDDLVDFEVVPVMTSDDASNRVLIPEHLTRPKWNGHIRKAMTEDLPFLRQMLYEAAFWRSSQERPPLEEALARPELSKILAGWGRDGDTGLIAVGSNETPAGAAWYRFWNREEHSYGFIDARTPELGLAVEQDMRRRGVGKELLQALMRLARKQGAKCISLSVEPDNVARRLYEQSGFEKVGEVGQAWTMVASLTATHGGR